jgi:tRNA pseudouridine55 synthase
MSRRKKGDPISGWINLDKPLGMTSTQAMAKVRWLLNAQKAGHAGTLDPLASGILPIAIGEATKTIPFAQDRIKTYLFTVTWGEQRDTDDAEGKVIGTSENRPLLDAIQNVLGEFTGTITQIPPRFSAIKIDGERAYDLARDGEEFEIKSREVYIQSLRLLEAYEGSAEFEAICGKGTYIRSLARDMALKLGTLGYVSALRRTTVGPFTLENAISLDNLVEMGDKAREVLLPLETALDDIPALAMKEDETAKLRSGQVLSFVSRPDFERLNQCRSGWDASTRTRLMCNSKPVALVEAEGPQVRPVRILNI